jgi:hypothetical protein
MCLAFGVASCDRPGKVSESDKGGPVSEPQSESSNRSSTKGFLENQVEHIGFPEFKAIDLPLSEVLSMIEDELNRDCETIGIPKVKITCANLAERRITIVLKNVKLTTLFDLIEEQALYQYSIDNERREIRFFFAGGDIFGDDRAAEGTSAGTKQEDEPEALLLPP